jgi:glycosyltransferase involved in cell wall biosynthesis
MRTLRLKNVIYFPNLNCVGGVETFCYEMGLKYGKDFDITVLYRNGDPAMMRHIAKVCRVMRYRPGDKVVCDVFIFGYGWEKDMFDNLEAKEIIQTFHADYICRHLNPCMDKRITKRFGVAENTTKGIVENYPWAEGMQTMYNPYTPKKPKKVLKLISATRLTPEKGFKRMIKLAEAFDKAEIPFHWAIYTDRVAEFPNKSVAVMPHRLDIIDFIADADYLVQLSDTEGYSYSIVEALSVGTPVICTEFPVAQEQGIVDGVTGFILPFDMSEIPVDKIYKGVKRFKCEPRESHYEQILAKGKSEYENKKAEKVTVKVKTNFFDLELDRAAIKGEEYSVRRERGEHLEDLGLVEVID